MRNFILKILSFFIKMIFGESRYLFNIIASHESNLFYNSNYFYKSKKGYCTNLYSPYKISDTTIGDYTYIAQNAMIKKTIIGKFCSIGPNLVCGWGIHPTNGISTSPMFYSTLKQNGMTLSKTDKIEETKQIKIGNDVFIGMNVSILDGVTIGDGAIIGAGAVVSKDIPPYAIAVGCPIKVIKFRFDNETRIKLLQSQWWDIPHERLHLVEKYFFNPEVFLEELLGGNNK